MTVPAVVCNQASPADVVAEVAASNASWLHSCYGCLAGAGRSARFAAAGGARGRLGAVTKAGSTRPIALLGSAVSTFEEGGLHLDVWHVGRSLAEARLALVIAMRLARASRRSPSRGCAGARLAAKLAREVAGELGIEVAACA